MHSSDFPGVKIDSSTGYFDRTKTNIPELISFALLLLAIFRIEDDMHSTKYSGTCLFNISVSEITVNWTGWLLDSCRLSYPCHYWDYYQLAAKRHAQH